MKIEYGQKYVFLMEKKSRRLTETIKRKINSYEWENFGHMEELSKQGFKLVGVWVNTCSEDEIRRRSDYRCFISRQFLNDGKHKYAKILGKYKELVRAGLDKRSAMKAAAITS